ncbi:MAG TPA: hypothetical protein VJJ52_02120 [Candidatus Nanoarchaeia archaeon]|nr:hypothetical protein [Candidatus Nanoarchaeia archaeon]
MLNRKSQGASEIFKYLIVIVISAVILVGGYKLINLVTARSCQADLSRTEIDLRNMNKGMRYGEKELKTLKMPCDVEKVYFLDLRAGINPNPFSSVPIIKDSLQTRAANNIFLAVGNDVKHSFYAGVLEIENPGYLCMRSNAGQISFFVEGAGESARITEAPGQILC